MTTTSAADDVLLTPEETAERFRVTPHTLRVWERQGIGPRRTRVGPHLVRYRVGDINAWLAEQQDRPQETA